MAPEIAQIAQLIRVGCNDPIADAFLAIADRSQEMSDEVDRLRAQLERAKEDAGDGESERTRLRKSNEEYREEVVRLREQLDRATEPRADAEPGPDIDEARMQLWSALQGAPMEGCPADVELGWLADRLSSAVLRTTNMLADHFGVDDWEMMPGDAYGYNTDALCNGVQSLLESTKPRPMSEAPRDGTWVLVAVQVRPDKHRWRTAHWDSKLGYWIEGGRKVLRGLREPVAWQPQALVPTSSGGGERARATHNVLRRRAGTTGMQMIVFWGSDDECHAWVAANLAGHLEYEVERVTSSGGEVVG